MNYIKNDVIELNREATIEDLVGDHWKTCQMSTINFMKDAHKKEQFIIKQVRNDIVYLIGREFGINSLIIKKVEGVIHLKKLTVKEISELLGYEVKIKEEEIK